MSALPTLLGLIGTFAVLWFLAGLLAWHLQALVLLLTHSARIASAAYDLLVLPGVVLHELAHIAAAMLLRVRVVRADLFRFRRRGDSRQGEVIVKRVDPLRMSLVGAAPLIAGVPVVLLLLRWLDMPPLGLTTAALAALRPVLREPGSLLILYLLWAVANAMFPSSADRAAWWVVGVIAAAIAGLLALTGGWPAIPPEVLQRLLAGAARLTSGLLPVAALDLCLLVAVVGCEWIAGRLTGRRVYR